ncbi:glucosaminidase domain-containing protein [Alteromonas sp. D210916BOD_24]|uniref:glucosaminidase domain-containing protein n=1 Tax=Alteromonas sp. D210916BOD_24 TaxID=3157618 RepID=UPI00399D4188
MSKTTLPYILGLITFISVILLSHEYLKNGLSSGLPVIDNRPANTLHSLPDLSHILDVKEKKEAFFSTLYPIIEEENKHLLSQRQTLLTLRQQPFLSRIEQRWLSKAITYYDVDPELPLQEKFTRLLRRVDYIPPSLVLTQAAIESGWGSARFSKKGNNLFGQWCFSKGCGMVPSGRETGKQHEVARFATVNASVRSYLKNLNTHFAYADLRTLRANLREANHPVTGLALASTLLRYSEEGPLYVKKVSDFIQYNELTRFNSQFDKSLLLASN